MIESNQTTESTMSWVCSNTHAVCVIVFWHVDNKLCTWFVASVLDRNKNVKQHMSIFVQKAKCDTYVSFLNEETMTTVFLQIEQGVLLIEHESAEYVSEVFAVN